MLAIFALISTMTLESISGPEVLGIRLGKSTIVDVLRTLGPADALFLGEHELEEPAARAEHLFARFITDFPGLPGRRAAVVVEIEPNEGNVARTYTLQLMDDDERPALLPATALGSLVRGSRRVVRHVLIFSQAGLEGQLSDCDAKDGPFETWVYRDSGAQVFPEIEAGKVKGIRTILYSPEIYSGAASFPPCE